MRDKLRITPYGPSLYWNGHFGVNLALKTLLGGLPF